MAPYKQPAPRKVKKHRSISQRINILGKHFSAVNSYYTAKEYQSTKRKNSDVSAKLSRAIRNGVQEGVEQGLLRGRKLEDEKERLRSLVLHSIMNDKTVNFNLAFQKICSMG